MPEARAITIQLRPEAHARLGTVWAWSLWSAGRRLLGSRYLHRTQAGARLAANVARARLIDGVSGRAPPSA